MADFRYVARTAFGDYVRGDEVKPEHVTQETRQHVIVTPLSVMPTSNRDEEG